jgi:hypothetical protein
MRSGRQQGPATAAALLSQNTLYAAFSGKLEKWTSAGGASVNVGNLNGTKKGFFAQNNAATPDKVFVDPDGNIATFTTATVTNSFDADLPAVNSVTQLDGYFVFTTGIGADLGVGQNAVTVNALAFTTDQTSGGLVRGITWQGRFLPSATRPQGLQRCGDNAVPACQGDDYSSAASPGRIAWLDLRTISPAACISWAMITRSIGWTALSPDPVSPPIWMG